MSKSSLPKDAADARQKGAGRFVCRINQGVFQTSGNTALYGIAEVIDNIERAGWVLDHVTWFEDRRDHPSAFCIFKAAGPAAPAPMPQQAYAPPPMPPAYGHPPIPPLPMPQGQMPPVTWGQQPPQ